MEYFFLNFFILFIIIIYAECFYKTIDGETFYISESKATWYDADVFCNKSDMNLLSIRTPKITVMIMKLNLKDEYWTGGYVKKNNFDVEWPYEWPDEEKYSNWGENNFYCVVIGIDGMWHIDNCLNSNYFICENLDSTTIEESTVHSTEFSITTETHRTGIVTPKTSDNVGSIMPILLTIPIALATLLSYGSAFLNMLLDALAACEITSEITVSNVEYCLDISKGVGEQNYFVSNVKANWFDALNFCRRNNMHLLRIYSVEENHQMKKFNLKESFWSGGNDLTNDHKWAWIGDYKDIPMQYTKWSRKQYKTNWNQYGNCVSINNDLTWTKDNCLKELKFVCGRNRDFSFFNLFNHNTKILEDLIGIQKPKINEICI